MQYIKVKLCYKYVLYVWKYYATFRARHNVRYCEIAVGSSLASLPRPRSLVTPQLGYPTVSLPRSLPTPLPRCPGRLSHRLLKGGKYYPG